MIFKFVINNCVQLINRRIKAYILYTTSIYPNPLSSPPVVPANYKTLNPYFYLLRPIIAVLIFWRMFV